MSPSLTSSPTFLSQVDTVPSSIVSLRRGILIISKLFWAFLSVDISLFSVCDFCSNFSLSEFVILFFCLESFLSKKDEISSFFSPIIANIESTGTVLPASTPI